MLHSGKLDMVEAKRFKSSITRKAVGWTLSNVDTDRYTVQEPTAAEFKVFDLVLLQMPFGSRAPHLIGVAFQLGPLRKSNFWRLEGRPRVEEIWVVHSGLKAIKRRDQGVVYVSLEDFQRMVAARPSEDDRLKTKRGKAMVANHQQITLNVSALVVLIDQRISELAESRPNSTEAIAEKDRMLDHYKWLRADILTLVDASSRLKTGKISEADAVKASMTLSEGVQKWWEKDHKQICSRTFDVGIFGSAVGICVMAGAGGPLAVGVAAALTGGKKLTDALKGLKGLWKAEQVGG